MARINIKSVTINSNSVFSSDTLRIILCPFNHGGGDLQEIAKGLEEHAAVFNFTLSNSKEKSLNIVFDYESILYVHIFTRSSTSNNKAYNYLDTWYVKNNSVKNETKNSREKLFKLLYDIENLSDTYYVPEVTGYSFQIFEATCNRKNERSNDEIRFEFIPDNDSSKKARLPVHHSYFSFRKGQTRRFTGEDSLRVQFKNKINLVVREIDLGHWPDKHDNLGEKDFTPNAPFPSYGSFKANRDDADYDITYIIREVKMDIEKKRSKFSWELSKGYDKLNFQPFFTKINDAEKRFSNILQELPEQETTQPNPGNDLSVLNDEINPLNSEEVARVNQFIKEYYQEFIDNPEMQKKYIEELTHSQYPVMAYPVYPEPAYYYLKQISDRFILPASGSLPDNSMALFVNNPAFVEAFLCGMNTEMGRELLWREYPTDSRGSYFRKFWDTEVKKDIREELRSDTFFDILPIHKWESQEFEPQNPHNLGQNHTAGKDNLLIFAIKGELLKKYPETIIYLSKATVQENKIRINPNAKKILPDLAAWLSEDTYIVGFPADLDELAGNPATKDPGYFLTFMNRPGETRFGFYGGNSSSNNPESHAGETAANLLVQPCIFGKHVSQFLTGWQNAKVNSQ